MTKAHLRHDAGRWQSLGLLKLHIVTKSSSTFTEFYTIAFFYWCFFKKEKKNPLIESAHRSAPFSREIFLYKYPSIVLHTVSPAVEWRGQKVATSKRIFCHSDIGSILFDIIQALYRMMCLNKGERERAQHNPKTQCMQVACNDSPLTPFLLQNQFQYGVIRSWETMGEGVLNHFLHSFLKFFLPHFLPIWDIKCLFACPRRSRSW